MNPVPSSHRRYQVLSISWQCLTFGIVLLLYPQGIFSVGIVAAVVGVSFAAAGVLRGRSIFANAAAFISCATFLLLTISQALSGLIEQYLPLTLLLFVMVLFGVELMSLNARVIAEASTQAEAILLEAENGKARSSSRETLGNISRLIVIFSSCYLLSLGLLFVGNLISTAVPFLGDISLYMIVVSVSFALVLLYREE